MTSNRATRIVGTLLVTGTVVCLAAQARSSGPQLAIVEPKDRAYVSRETMLRAEMTPPEAASAVSFFVDGRQICVVTVAPLECEWDAGRSVAEHQVRVVATLVAGGRLV